MWLVHSWYAALNYAAASSSYYYVQVNRWCRVNLIILSQASVTISHIFVSSFHFLFPWMGEKKINIRIDCKMYLCIFPSRKKTIAMVGIILTPRNVPLIQETTFWVNSHPFKHGLSQMHKRFRSRRLLKACMSQPIRNCVHTYVGLYMYIYIYIFAENRCIFQIIEKSCCHSMKFHFIGSFIKLQSTHNQR